jgi:microcystin degradation protein MlrC
MTVPNDIATDIATLARPGAILKTRDRRQARILSVDAANGFIDGEVPMFGPCRWRPDGRYAEAPAGAAGPLDLVVPAPAPEEEPKRQSLIAALADPETGGACCD